MSSIDGTARDFGDYHYPILADTVKYTLNEIFICNIKKPCSDHEESE
jgi:hypothetical protein